MLWSGAGTGQLVGLVNGVPVITITANANGTYSVVISGPIDHPNDGRPGQEDDLTLIIPVTADDGKGGVATSNMAVVIEDDGPSVSVVADAEIVAALDEGDQDAGSPSTGVASVIATGAIVRATIRRGRHERACGRLGGDD